jgi:GNAT superfamily N-acetyltransferase
MPDRTGDTGGAAADRGAPTDELVLRRAAGPDVPGITRLVRAAYEGYEPLLGRTPFPMLTDYASAIRLHEVWLLEDPAGAIAAVLELVPEPDRLWIENVAVDPVRQGRGLGRRLLRFAEAEARRRRLPSLGLLTNERYLANIAMYERYGYVETHREPRQGTDVIHFRKPTPDAGPDGADGASDAAGTAGSRGSG